VATLLSVNVSLPRAIVYRSARVVTGIFKEPVHGGVVLRTRGLDGDGQADLRVHGGPDKAVYVYSMDHYAYWARELGRADLTPGQFGENFTVEGLEDDQVHVGDLVRVGGALVQVTQPRTPCYKLGIRMGLAHFPTLFLTSCRVGFYLRVVEEGRVAAGDRLERVAVDPERMTVSEIFRLRYFDPENLEGARRALHIRALAPGWRRSFRERLARADRCLRDGEAGDADVGGENLQWEVPE